ncbi:DNA polymerase beta superfamily protein [Ornithinimicrobium murale]|uniref:DNA polymerase beta superfamily protein n=1 Tax=Ornithinimicrobium murale TaxID=1050153 RepID=UPI000E0D72F1|nr:nucleotidyltransferase domain-containing protein [Ornithinimicrobium murale]
MKHPLDSAPVLIHALTGSQAHGTATEFSDVDITRVTSFRTEQLAGLSPVPVAEHQRQTIKGILDVTDIDVATFLRHVVKGSARHFEVLYSPLAAPRCETGAMILTARPLLVTQSAVRHAYRGYIASLAAKVVDPGPNVTKELAVLHRLLAQATELWTTGDLDLRIADPGGVEDFVASFTGGDTEPLADLMNEASDMFAGLSPLSSDTAAARGLAADLVMAARAGADQKAPS